MKSKHRVSSLFSTPYGDTVSVTVIGAGGTGSLLLSTLARLNQAYLRLRRVYLHVKVFDFDTVSDTNVARQCYSPADIGHNKATTLVTRLNRFYNTKWYGFPMHWEEQPNLTQANLIITCVDTASTRIKLSEQLEEWANTKDHVNKFAYWMDTGNTRTTANVIMGGYNKDFNGEDKPEPKLPFVTDMFDLTKYEAKDTTPHCSLAEALAEQHIMINSYCANLASSLVWDLLTKPYLDWRGGYINLDNYNIKRIKI